MEKEKSVDEIQSIDSDKTIVSSSKKTDSTLNESDKISKNKTEYAGARPKIEHRTIWNSEKHSYTMRLMQKDLEMGLRHCLSGDEADVLNQSLRPSAHILWYEIIAEVKSDLCYALVKSYPSMQSEVYGSTLMGIAFKDSVLNFYIKLFPKSQPITGYQVIDDIRRLLQKSQNFTKISEAMRSPILNCLHIKTGYFCHLNLFEPIGTINSPILAHLLTFDARIDFLAAVIKGWMKVHHCYGQRRIKNYALMWMLVFYLQSIPLPIIPPIIQFQMHVSEIIVDDFNFAFDYNYPNNTRNKQRCANLLLGFFKFYDRFDFENLVICPLFGRAFARNDVKVMKLAEFAKYEAILKNNQDKRPLFMKDYICIQDPFEITKSIPVQFAPNVFSRFTSKIAFAAELIEEELKQSGESTNLLLKLFDVELFHQGAQFHQNQCYSKF